MCDPKATAQSTAPATELLLTPAELRARLADSLAAVAIYRGLVRLAERVSTCRGRAVSIPVAPTVESRGVRS